jgi:hypothetical protein
MSAIRNWPARSRILLALVAYFSLCVIAAFVYPALRELIPKDSSIRPTVFAIAGPSLSLFTHMSYALFAVQTPFVAVWLVCAAVSKKRPILFVLAFMGSWLAVGYFMSHLFL